MSPRWPPLLLSLLLLAGVAAAEDSPDFERFMALVEQALAGGGAGRHPGERSELYRYTDDGWSLHMMVIWDGERWRLLAVDMAHPERRDAAASEWRDRYQALLGSIRRDGLGDRLRLLPEPELFEVPPPDFNPALPEEQRSRRFSHDGFWYEVRWENVGGVDDRARWALLGYSVVALPW